jgi:hypothetical protein
MIYLRCFRAEKMLRLLFTDIVDFYVKIVCFCVLYKPICHNADYDPNDKRQNNTYVSQTFPEGTYVQRHVTRDRFADLRPNKWRNVCII